MRSLVEPVSWEKIRDILEGTKLRVEPLEHGALKFDYGAELEYVNMKIAEEVARKSQIAQCQRPRPANVAASEPGGMARGGPWKDVNDTLSNKDWHNYDEFHDQDCWQQRPGYWKGQWDDWNKAKDDYRWPHRQEAWPDTDPPHATDRLHAAGMCRDDFADANS